MERQVESRGYSGAQHWQEIHYLTLPDGNPLSCWWPLTLIILALCKHNDLQLERYDDYSKLYYKVCLPVCCMHNFNFNSLLGRKIIEKIVVKEYVCQLNFLDIFPWLWILLKYNKQTGKHNLLWSRFNMSPPSTVTESSMERHNRDFPVSCTFNCHLPLPRLWVFCLQHFTSPASHLLSHLLLYVPTHTTLLLISLWLRSAQLKLFLDQGKKKKNTQPSKKLE